MLRSRAEGNDVAFYSIALQAAASEARQGRREIAQEMRDEVARARASTSRGQTVAIPFASPRGNLEGLLELRDPHYKLKDVVLKDRLLSRFEDILRQQRKRDWLREHGKVPTRRLLFVGPPGSGKTMSAEAIAGELHLPLYVIRLEGMITRYMGETAAKLRLIFDETAKRRGVYLFDEFDAVGGRRAATNDVAEMRRVLNSFLQFMEEDNSTDSIIICSTNHPSLRVDDGLPRVLFTGEGLVMSLAFNAAYEAAEAFSRLYAARCPGAGFLKTILLRRIGSSAKAGLETARHILERIDSPLVSEDEVGDEGLPTEETPPDPQEIELLRNVERNLASVVGGTGADPKVEVILHYLRERNWLERNGTTHPREP